MRATVSGLPTVLRLALGLFTVGVFAFFGLMERLERPVLGYILLGLAVFRLSAWGKEVLATLKASSKGD